MIFIGGGVPVSSRTLTLRSQIPILNRKFPPRNSHGVKSGTRLDYIATTSKIMMAVASRQIEAGQLFTLVVASERTLWSKNRGRFGDVFQEGAPLDELML